MVVEQFTNRGLDKGSNAAGADSFRLVGRASALTIVSKAYLNTARRVTLGGVKLFLTSDFERTFTFWTTRRRLQLNDDDSLIVLPYQISQARRLIIDAARELSWSGLDGF
jgi:hypothetical protein